VVLFWQLLTKRQDYAFGRPCLTRKISMSFTGA
jgi:hypothetical protein